MDNERKCKHCGSIIIGRSDKIFCNAYCKSANQYETSKDNEEPIFKRIDKQLRLNRRILKQYNKSGKTVVRKEELINQRFNPKYFTHYWKNKKGDVYLFCYEFGYLSKNENGTEKFVLVHWQNYME